VTNTRLTAIFLAGSVSGVLQLSGLAKDLFVYARLAAESCTAGKSPLFQTEFSMQFTLSYINLGRLTSTSHRPMCWRQGSTYYNFYLTLTIKL